MNKIRTTTQTIKIDASRRVDCPLNAKVLLYDNENECYYETTIEHICGALVRRIDVHFAELEQSIDNRVAEIERKNAEFIEDTARVNQSLIEMVEHNN